MLLAAAPEFYHAVPWLMLWPGLAVLFTTLAFNLLGDGLRDAFDPRSPSTRSPPNQHRWVTNNSGRAGV